jgi:hypothetical protein
MSWRNSLLDIAVNDHNSFEKEELVNYDVYQFGVFNGGSMKEIASILNKHKIEVNAFHGFDVFTGMPKETAEPIFQDSWNPDIFPDEFNVLKYMSLDTPDDCAKYIEQEVQNIFTSRNNQSKVSVVAGLVEETLPKQKDLKPAFYVDFDLDIYSPTKYVFDYLMENNLIVPGTLIGYDDWGGTPGFEEFKDGESRAHKEILDKWGISMTKLYQNGYAYPHVQTLWIVDSLE